MSLMVYFLFRGVGARVGRQAWARACATRGMMSRHRVVIDWVESCIEEGHGYWRLEALSVER